MRRDFVPAKDSDLATWSANFSAKLTASPVTYGLVAADATAYAAADTAFQAAYTDCANPATRTQSTVATKDTDRASLVALARGYARIIQAHPGITATNLSDLGLTVRDFTRTPVAPPTTSPVVTIEVIAPGLHVLRIVDSTTPASQAKPDGVRYAEVWEFVGIAPPASIDDCTYKGHASKFLRTVIQDPADKGKQAYYITRWVSQRGDRGPVSNTATAVVA